MFIEYNSEKISKALDDFYNALGIDIDLLKPDFSYAIDTPLQNNKYCKLIQGTSSGNEQCKCSDRLLLTKCKETKKPQMHICHAGLIDVAFPIIYEDNIIGYIVFGRMRPDTNFASVKKYVASLGIACDDAEKLYVEIPVFDDKKIESISDLENLDFVNVSGSAQRLAWNSLQHYDIDYNIKKTVNSQFDAFKLVKNSENLHTFLNS